MIPRQVKFAHPGQDDRTIQEFHSLIRNRLGTSYRHEQRLTHIEMPIFSVITITLNNRNGLNRTAASVTGQIFPDYEFIVIDGGSTDGTQEVIRQYADRISYWISEPDLGIYDAMNKGLAAAKGNYIYFLNSGDSFINECILCHVWDEIKIADDVDLFYGNVLLVNEKGPTGFLSFQYINAHFLFTNMVCHQGIFAKRELFEKFGNFVTHYQISGDYDWVLRTFLRKSIKSYFLNLTVANFTIGGLSWSRRDLRKEERIKIQRKYFSVATMLIMDFLMRTKLIRLCKRTWIDRIIVITSYRKWKRLGFTKPS